MRTLSPAPVRTDYTAVKAAIHRKLIQNLNLERMAQMDRGTVLSELTQIIETLVDNEGTPITGLERERLAREVLDEVFGLGPLEPLMRDTTVADILVNGCRNVYVERRGKLERTDVQFRDDAHLRLIIDRIVSAVGRR